MSLLKSIVRCIAPSLSSPEMALFSGPVVVFGYDYRISFVSSSNIVGVTLAVVAKSESCCGKPPDSCC